MFHTLNFENLPVTRVGGSSKPKSPRNRKVNRSCKECTRRKIKCDGGQPCANCRFNKLSPACEYRHRSRRHAISVTEHQEVFLGLEAHRDVLSTLFPSTDISDLRGKTRDQLLQLLSASSINTGSVDPESDIDDSGQISENGDEFDRRWDELQPGADESMLSSDDINAVSLAYDQHRRSYLGAASISAILRVIFRLCPDAKSCVALSAQGWPTPSLNLQIGKPTNPGHEDDARCVDAYFKFSHCVAPMLDEAEFKSKWQTGCEQEASWQGLFNMVCTMGSIAAGHEAMHKLYYHRAQTHLTLETFGSGNLESVQALCLLGGCYLQYMNSPNMATAVLGAAYRMAFALGLHRDAKKSSTTFTSPPGGNSVTHESTLSRIETRRRTWWSLFCFDVWTSTTMGRPTSGRWDSNSMDTHLPTPVNGTDYAAISLDASARFCLLGNQIQDRFAQFGRMTFGEVVAFDKQLQDWQSNLPDVLKSPNTCPGQLLIPRDFMRNRYINLRLILYRPAQLHRFNARGSIHEIKDHELMVHNTCHELAMDAVDSISKTWTRNRVHVWNASWYLFQAAMVPLLTLAQKAVDQVQSNNPASKDMLKKILDLLHQMEPWMRSADRSRHIIVAILDALSSEEIRCTPSVSDGDVNFFGWYDDQVTFGDDIDWSQFLVDDEIIRDTNRNGHQESFRRHHALPGPETGIHR